MYKKLKFAMKNPFEKNDHKVLIVGIVIGSVIVGAAAYLFLTETGASVRGELAGHFNRMRGAFLGDDIEPLTDAPHTGSKSKTSKKKADEPVKDENSGAEGARSDGD